MVDAMVHSSKAHLALNDKVLQQGQAARGMRAMLLCPDSVRPLARHSVWQTRCPQADVRSRQLLQQSPAATDSPFALQPRGQALAGMRQA